MEFRNRYGGGHGTVLLCINSGIYAVIRFTERNAGGSIVSQYLGWIKGAIVTDGSMAAFQRYMMLYGLSFVLAVILIGLKKYKEDKKCAVSWRACLELPCFRCLWKASI